jgi:hypothetical protein
VHLKAFSWDLNRKRTVSALRPKKGYLKHIGNCTRSIIGSIDTTHTLPPPLSFYIAFKNFLLQNILTRLPLIVWELLKHNSLLFKMIILHKYKLNFSFPQAINASSNFKTTGIKSFSHMEANVSTGSLVSVHKGENLTKLLVKKLRTQNIIVSRFLTGQFRCS